MLKQEQGFVCLLAVLASTIFLFALALVFAFKAMALQKRSLHQCYRFQLDEQKHQARILRDLLSLNSLAHTLNQKRRLATLALQVARAHPASFAAAKTALGVIKAQQRVLHSRQQALLAQSKLGWSKMDTLALGSILNQTVSSNHPDQLPVIPIPSQWGSTSFQVPPTFSALQTSQLGWHLSLEVQSPLLVKALNSRRLRLPITCSTTLHKRGHQWIPVMREARALSNFAL